MKKEKIINGIQQIGIGVVDANKVFNWYRKYLGFDILVFQDVAPANLMTRYTDGMIHNRYAMLAMNMIGGGGLEIWQYKDRIPKHATEPFLLGDLGINVMKIRSNAIEKVHETLKQLTPQFLTSIENETHFFFSDPWGNLVQVVHDDYCFCKTSSSSGGVLGAIVGVSNMDTALNFYQRLLGYETQVSERSEVFTDFKELAGAQYTFRRILLKHPKKQVGGFGELYGPSEIELIQVLDREPVKIYKDRLWGDLGYMHLCFDVSGIDVLYAEAEKLGYGFTVDSANSFDMGEAAGRFGYVEDPDGTLIEFVETHKVPIIKNLGIYINLKKRNPIKPLSRFLVKALRFHRVKKDI